MMPVCIRFVDKDLTIKEELLDIVSLPRITCVHIANKIRDVISKLGLEISNCRGQGYDRASNMRSERVGVQALIRQDHQRLYICNVVVTALIWLLLVHVLFL